MDESTYGVDGNDLSVGLLDLVELSEEVPESGLGNDLVGGEDPHSEELKRLVDGFLGYGRGDIPRKDEENDVSAKGERKKTIGLTVGREKEVQGEKSGY